MNEPPSQVINFTPPLPCAKAAATDSSRCGNPATVASSWMHDDGTWHMLPLCKECVDTMHANSNLEEQQS